MYQYSWILLSAVVAVGVFPAKGVYFNSDCREPIMCNIPGDLLPEETPQMITITYTGAVNYKSRTKLSKLLTVKNPDQCPIRMTLFVISQDTDICSLRKMYGRGHEVALAGINRTKLVTRLDVDKWNETIKEQQVLISKNASIPESDIIGMRAQMFRAGGNDQFDMLEEYGFVYDSSLIFDRDSHVVSDTRYAWPFTVQKDLLRKARCMNNCPTYAYDYIYEVPVFRLFGTQMGKPINCTYLDECISEFSNAGQVKNLLMKHFFHLLYDNRAPLQINLRARTLESKLAMDGLKLFLDTVIQRQDTWVVTIQDLINWVERPTPNFLLAAQGFWECQEQVFINCTEIDVNKTVVRVTFDRVLDARSLWIWQSVILIIFYIAIMRYDEYVDEKVHSG